MSIKNISKFVFVVLLVTLSMGGNAVLAAVTISQGGTGTSTAPTLDQILSGQLNGTYKYTNANAANGWLKLDSNGNFTGKTIQFLAASTSLSSIVLDKGELGVASDTPGYVVVGDGTTAGGIQISTPWKFNGTSIYYTAGFVGIGTSTPQRNLDLYGTNFRITNSNPAGGGGGTTDWSQAGAISLTSTDQEVFIGANGDRSTSDAYFKINPADYRLANGEGDINFDIIGGGAWFNFTDSPVNIVGNGLAVNSAFVDATPVSSLDVHGNASFGSYAGSVAAPTNGFIVSGNVGIGTSSPISTLAIVGTTTITQGLISQGLATSTFQGSINLPTGKCFSVNNVCVTSGGGGTPGGSNTQVQYNNSGSFAGSSNLTFDGTSLTAAGSLTAGVNVIAGSKFKFSSSTLSFLTVDGSDDVFLQAGAAISIVPFAGSNLNLAPSAGGIVYDSGTKTGIGTSSPIAFVAIQPANNVIPTFVVASSTGSIPSIIVDTKANVGIGTSSPSNKLEVVGNGFFSGNLQGANITATGTLSVTGVTTLGNITGSTQCLHVNSSGVVSGTASDCGSGGGSGTVGSGTTGQVPYYAANGTTLTATSTLFLSNQKVGIGTSTLPYKLTVAGQIGATDIFSNGSFFGDATSTSGSSIVLGSVHDTGSVLGANNFVAGPAAGQFSNGGSNNIFIGFTAGQDTTGGDNIFLGDQAGSSNSSGGGNVFLGEQAGTSNDTGINNVFLGLAAGSGNITGADNVLLGTGAGTSITDGSENVAIGRSAGANLDTGANNSFLGYHAGISSIGANNTFLGIAAGAGETSGSYNIAIGNGADVPIASGDQQLNIGNLIYGTGAYGGGGHTSTPANGNVGIGTSSPVYPFTVMTSSSSLVPSLVIASSTINGSHFGQLAFGVGADSANSAADAEYIYNPLSGGGFTNVTRLFLGAPSHNFYVLNLSNITSGIEGLATMAITGTYGSNNCYAFTDCSLSMSRDGNNIRFNDNFPGDSTNAFTFNISNEVARITQAGLGLGTTTPDSRLDVNGTMRLEGTSTLVTASISGAITGIGCDSTDTAVVAGLTLASTTAYITTPQTYPGDAFFWKSYTLDSTHVRTKVCSDVTATPTASTYNVKIIQ